MCRAVALVTGKAVGGRVKSERGGTFGGASMAPGKENAERAEEKKAAGWMTEESDGGKNSAAKKKRETSRQEALKKQLVLQTGAKTTKSVLLRRLG